jgi:TRAP-type mannitol/chloroaromatic compound transport system permease large subunit
MRATTMVIFILIGSTAFALVFRALSGDKFVFDLMANLPGGDRGFLIVSMLIVFFLGFFIDFFEICFIVIPLFVPVAKALGFDQNNLIWFGVLLGANLQTSFLTPPFGFALFYLRGVAPAGVTTGDIYRGVIPFIAIQLMIVVILIFFPQLALWLPAVSFGQ